MVALMLVMKRILVVLLALLVACAPAPVVDDADTADNGLPEQKKPKVVTKEQVDSPSQEVPEVEPVVEDEPIPVGPSGDVEAREPEPYTDLPCRDLLTVEEFASACEQEARNLVVTYKEGTKNCFVNVKDRQNERLTAGVTMTEFKSADDAKEEFERRLKIFNVGADASVGERAYEFPKVDRQTINFVRGPFIVEVGSDTRLCPEVSLLSVAKMVDGRLS